MNFEDSQIPKFIPKDFSSLEEYTGAVVDFLEKFNDVFNYDTSKNEYVNQFLIANHWKSKLPDEWKTPLLQTSTKELLHMAKTQKSQKHFPKTLKRYILDSKRLKLQKLPMSKKVKLNNVVKRHMNRKKLHEIERLSKCVIDIINEKKISCVLDLGCGKGYLTQTIGYFFPNVEIVGIDNSEEQIKSFKTRKEILEQRINKKNMIKDIQSVNELQVEIVNHSEEKKKEIESKKEQKNEKKKTLYNVKYVIKNLSLDNLSQINKFIKGGRAMIIGLHCCGDLSPYCLKVFAHCKKIVSCVNVSCCYFKLTESYGFPMSSCVKKRLKKFNCTSGLALGCFAVEKWEEKNSIFQFRIRSMRFAFEALLYEWKLRSDKLRLKFNGRNFPKNIETFAQYTRWSFGKLKDIYKDKATEFDSLMNGKGFDEKVTKFYEKFNPQKNTRVIKEVECYWCIRAVAAPIVETLVALDRMLYLKECKDVKEVEIKRIFQQSISPRSIVLIGGK